MKNKKFEGWYFKHQQGNNTVALIPGKSANGTFVQLLLPDGSRYYDTSGLSVNANEIRTGNCVFTTCGCKISLPGVHGSIEYGKFTALGSDIMGPFRFFPMECRHGVISMGHTLKGSLEIEGKEYNFDGGTGYIEKDSGTSFPSEYQWIQCNAFPEQCSIMISIARIPFCGLCFRGCICAVIYRGREYRLATYNGVHIVSSDETHICLLQRGIKLNAEILLSDAGHSLKSPVTGHMIGTVRERTDVGMHIKMWEHNRPVFDLKSTHAAYEYVARRGE